MYKKTKNNKKIEKGHSMKGDKILKTKCMVIIIMLDDEIYVGTLWMLITDKSPKTNTTEYYMRDTKSYCTRPMFMYRDYHPKSGYTRAQRNEPKFCDQYGKSFSRKELFTVTMIGMRVAIKIFQSKWRWIVFFFFFFMDFILEEKCTWLGIEI